MPEIKAILVSVDYADLLAMTLPRNARYFSRIVVVTTAADTATREVCEPFGNVTVFATDAFYRNGAVFNKGLAIEEGFDVLGRSGWILVTDADIVIPPEFVDNLELVEKGFLYGARRQLLADPTKLHTLSRKELDELPRIPGHDPYGYFQLFHADDPCLESRPWYPVDWLHAGGCDNDFQRKWPRQGKQWLPMSVIHLGEDGKNWCGRVTPSVDDGRVPDAAAFRSDALQGFLRNRKKIRNTYTHDHEKFPVTDIRGVK